MNRIHLTLPAIIISLCLSLNANAYDLSENGISYNILSTQDRTVTVAAYHNDAEPGIFIDITDEERPADAKGIGYNLTTTTDSKTYSLVIPRNVMIGTEVYTVTTISPAAFANKQFLRSITIPSTVTQIGNSAFSACIRLDTICCNATVPANVTTNTFDGISTSKCKLIVPKGYTEAYTNANVWSMFACSEASMPACEPPTVEIRDGKLLFECATPAAVCHYTITSNFSTKGTTTNTAVNISPTYIVTAYANAEGYTQSETITCTLTQQPTNRYDVNGDGKVSMSDANEIVNYFITHTVK